MSAPKPIHAVPSTVDTEPAPKPRTGLVVIESPYAGNRRRNAADLAACMRDSFARGEAPYASHALYTQYLDDDVPAERELGIEAGLAWGAKADLTSAYVDLGVSPGMRVGIERAKAEGRAVEFRTVSGWVWPAKNEGGK
ncbi:MAG TPA: hypothetical protein VIY73_18815 [Polyangiaceae bacterium]